MAVGTTILALLFGVAVEILSAVAITLAGNAFTDAIIALRSGGCAIHILVTLALCTTTGTILALFASSYNAILTFGTICVENTLFLNIAAWSGGESGGSGRQIWC